MLKILVAGDYCPIGRTEEYLRDANYSGLFNGFEQVVAGVDYSIVNFECPVTRSNVKRLKTGPCLKTEDNNALKALQYAGFNLLTLANNHIQDYGGDGVLDTIRSAKEHGFDTVGAGTLSDAGEPLVKDINGIRVGFINIAENEFCAVTAEMPGANTFDFIKDTKTVQKLRASVDKIILIYHGGREHYQLPTPEQRRRFRYFIDIGVDAIIAHHTHCVSGFEYYEGKPIVYSLGNFIFDYKRKYQKGKWTRGMSAILSLKRPQDNFSLELIPHVQGTMENSTLVLMQGKEKEEFMKEIDSLSAKIVDDRLFEDEWKSYLKSQEWYYLPSVFVRSFYIRALFMKGILPISLLKSKRNLLALNLIRCEAHNEILKGVLEK